MDYTAHRDKATRKACNTREVGDRRADRATTADHDALAHATTVSGLTCWFQGREPSSDRRGTRPYGVRK
jgi:hypothetical protein